MVWATLVGDYYGSYFTTATTKSYNLPLDSAANKFTSHSLLALTTKKCLIEGGSFKDGYKDIIQKYPDVFERGALRNWGLADKDYNGTSKTSEAASRISCLVDSARFRETIDKEIESNVVLTHDDPEAIKSAKAVAAAIYYLGQDMSIPGILTRTSQEFGYDMDFDLAKMNKTYEYSDKAENIAPLAIYIGLTSKSFMDALRLGYYVGGNNSAVMSIACTIAYAKHQEIPEKVLATVKYKLREKYPELYSVLA